MTRRLLILCSGQGGQHAGMFDLARAHPASGRLLARPGVSDDPAVMFDNGIAQPSIVAGALALWQALRDSIPAPGLVAGYSIGELAAWAVAGSLGPVDAIALARTRALAMDEAARAGPPQALAAVSGVALDKLVGLAAAHGFEIAIVNGHDACIAGGLEGALAPFEAAVAADGGKLQRLQVAVASHTSLMMPAVSKFEAALDAAAFGTPACPVLSGVRAVPLHESSDALRDLPLQLVRTIRWSDCMDAAAEAGIKVALELGPGAALARMLQARHPHIASRSVSEFRSIGGIAAWVNRAMDEDG